MAGKIASADEAEASKLHRSFVRLSDADSECVFLHEGCQTAADWELSELTEVVSTDATLPAAEFHAERTNPKPEFASAWCSCAVWRPFEFKVR
jgi:hypothetical protein